MPGYIIRESEISKAEKADLKIKPWQTALQKKSILSLLYLAIISDKVNV